MEESKILVTENIFCEEIETNLLELVNKIFADEPTKPNSMQLLVDDIEQLNKNDFCEIEKEIVFFVALHGIKKLYGDSIQISNITREMLDNLNNYMHVIGYHILFEIIENDIEYKYKISFEHYLNNNEMIQKKMNVNII